MDVVPIETPQLGNRGYLVHDGETGVVIDPPRDIDRVLDAAAGIRITHVLETHIHNDYVTGGPALCRATGAGYVLPAGDEVAFDRRQVADGDEIASGALTVRAIRTPGHTPNHTSYLAIDGAQRAVCTGGSLLYGTVGRTDLIAADRTEELTRRQFRSVRRLLTELPPDTAVYPTHGFGSFCAAVRNVHAAAAGSTIAAERAAAAAVAAGDEDAFVRDLLGGLVDYPRYYAHMAEINRSGPPDAEDLPEPPRISGGALLDRIRAGEWVVDLRSRIDFAAGHLAGTVGVELGASFATYLGWIMPWGAPLTLLGSHAEQVARARRDLSLIGIDRIAGAAVGAPASLAGDRPLRSYPVADFAALAASAASAAFAGHAGHAGSGVVLDVRRDDEWRAGHVASAVHIPFHDLPARRGDVPGGDPVWIYCASGLRASIAAGLLQAYGRDVVLINDHFARAAAAGVPVER